LNKKKRKKKKQIKEKNKGKNGLGKIASMKGATLLLQRHPQITSCIPGSHFTHMSEHPLATSHHVHGLDETFLETSPFLWILAQYDVLSFSPVLYCRFL
jgi:hypothetical protein